MCDIYRIIYLYAVHNKYVYNRHAPPLEIKSKITYTLLSIMEQKTIPLKSVVELNTKTNTLYQELMSGSVDFSKLVNYQITLLEIFNYELKRLERLGYCDYELAYVCFKLAMDFYSRSVTVGEGKTEFLNSLKATLAKKNVNFQAIKKVIVESSGSCSGFNTDPILARFNSLNSKPSNQDLPIHYFELIEAISPTDLHNILKLDNKHLILLIDYRTSKDFNHNHINYVDTINIEPAQIELLYSKQPQNITDQDLEARLKLHLPAEQFLKFQNRNKYDLIVMYNLRFGSPTKATDRIANLVNALETQDTSTLPKNNPFQKLTELLMFKNKYISSKLKHHPCYLDGGVYNWHATFGDTSLKRSAHTPVLSRPEASLTKGENSTSISRKSSYSGTESSILRTSSPYLRNFGEYLATAKSTSETPISNLFAPSSSSMSSNGMNSSSISSNGINLNGSSSGLSNGLSNGSSSQPSTQKLPSKPPAPLSRRSLSTTSIQKTVSNGKSSNGLSDVLEKYATGLVNLGNSCYMNCVLQCLGATPQLTKFFFPSMSSSASPDSLSLQSYRQHINVNNNLGSKGILTTNFVGLLINMLNNSGKSYSPGEFKKVVGSLSPAKQFASFDQQDCIEFLNFLLDGLHEDLNQMVVSNAAEKKAITELSPEEEKIREILPVRLASTVEWERYLKLNFSIVVDYFQGQYLSQLRCLECRMSSTTYNAFSILSLPIPEKLGSAQSLLLDACLKEFTTTELLDDNNKWHCPRCKKFTKLTKKISITRLPQVLIIHFKRFKISPTGYFNKLDTFINYPVNETLDLTSYWPKTGTFINSELTGDVMTYEQEDQLLSKFPQRNQNQPFQYKLYGVANHFGNLTTGHYTSYVHKESDKKKTRGWCYFDDSKVTFNCSPSQVLNKNAYCLFYQRI